MDWYVIVKRHFDAGRYRAVDVGKFVIAGKITSDQYEEVTGQVYEVSV
ncbi:XkdX family protein [Paenibacillus kobensis]|nr:XkdX family protein [Paenibacillus kobensis]